MSQAFDARRREIFRINFEPCPALLISEFVLGAGYKHVAFIVITKFEQCPAFLIAEFVLAAG